MRITRFIRAADSDRPDRRLQQFQLNIEPAERIDELKLEVTAPTMAEQAEQARPTPAGPLCASISGIASDGVAASRAEQVRGPRIAERRHARSAAAGP